MTEFKLSKEEWYKKRDDRTNRLIQKNIGDDFSIGIIIDPNIATSFSLQYMTIVTCNILARWCRKIVIDIPACKAIIPRIKDQDLNDYLKQEMYLIDPFGDFQFDTISENDCTFTLSIGNPTRKLDSSYWIDADNWIAGCGYGNGNILKRSDSTNPSGPALAACFGNAALFKHAVSSKDATNFVKYYSLFDYSGNIDPNTMKNPDVTNSLSIGNICQIGCGAVGSSFDFLLSLTSFEANLQIIDFDSIQYENCNSSLAFTAYSAQDNISKVDSCENILKSHLIDIQKYPKSYEEFTDEPEFSKYNPDLILCLANEQNVWNTIQHNYPATVLHATTTENWAINFGRHIPINEWCILCRFLDMINVDFEGQCGKGIIADDETEILGTLPFLPPCGSTFILSEIIKMNCNYITGNNSVYFNLASLIGNSEFRGKRKGCICNEQYSDIFIENRKDTKLSKFFIN